MKKTKMTALCLSAAIALSSVTTPVLAYADKGKAQGNIKIETTIKLDKTNAVKIAPGKIKFMFADSEQFMDMFAWALKSIEKLGAKGIISGYSDKCYKPQNKVTNLEALTLILKLTDHKEDAEKNDKVHSALAKYQRQWGIKWGWGYLYVAIEEGILLPEEIKDFNPNQPIKRHELAKYLVRAMGLKKEAEKHMNSKLNFKDANAIPKASRGYVYVVNDLGIMTGNEKDQFKPNEPLTRAEIAVVIDRAESYFNNDEDENEAKVVFQSYDNNKLTVMQNGEKVSYRTVDGVIVYKDKEYTSVEALEKGDVLEIVLNNSRQVIFIEVIGHVDDENDEDDENENREAVKFTKVNYNRLPEPIKKKIDTNRVSKGYEAYKYDDEIYLIAYMGRKNTGGYAIDIENVERYKVNSNYIVEATVVETVPDKNAIVTQAITYPYTVVKFDNFDKLGRVYFVDENGKILARKNIEKLDEAATATGYFSKVVDNHIYIKTTETSTALTKYELSEDVLIYINDEEKELKDLKDGMEVKLSIVNDKVTEISAEYEIKKAEGTIQLVDTGRNQIRVKYENKLTTYSIDDDAEIFIDGKETELSELEFGMKVYLELMHNKVIKIDAVNFEESYEGRIKDIEIENDEVKSITILVNNSRVKFTITKDTYFDMLDDDAEPTNLAINSVVEIKLLNGKVIEVIEIK